MIEVDPDKESKETPQKYRDMISAYDAEFKNWISRGKEIVKIYRDDDKTVSEGKMKRVWSKKSFNILWSNVQTMLPAYYSRTPQSFCERKFSDPDPLGKFAAEIAERVGDCLAKKPEYGEVLAAVVKDRLLPGRGTAWVRVEAEYGDPLIDPETNQPVMQDDQPVRQVIGGRIIPEYVGWQDYGHQVANHESKIKVKWRKVEFDKEAAEARFGEEKANQIDYNKSPSNKADDKKDSKSKTATIIELCDMNTRKFYWFEEDEGDEYLDVKDDILGLSKFWPCPKPLYSTLTTDSLVPIADYCYYQELAEQLNLAVTRRQLIIAAIRVVGAYNAKYTELKKIIREADENEMIGVKDFVDFMGSGGLAGNMAFLPVEPLVKVLTVLTQEIGQLKSEIYEITGISDIIRGTTSPNETATAQQLKGQFATLRISPGQREVQRFGEELLRIMIELALEKLPEEQIAGMVNLGSFSPEEQEMFLPALELLRNDQQRDYRVEIETDSMAAIDENGEKERVVQAVDSLSGYLEKATQNIQMMPMLAPVWGEGLMLLARSMRGGRAFEHTIEKNMKALIEQAQQPPPEQPPPPPDPSVMKNEADAQKGAIELQLKDRELQLKERQQMFEEDVKKAEFTLKEREMAVREAETAIKKLAEDNKLKVEQEKALLDIIQSGNDKAPMPVAQKSESSQSSTPTALTIHMPNQSARKRVVMTTDPLTGNRIGEMQDITEED
jgi:hypothetical protein